MKVGALKLGTESLQEVFAGRHLLRGDPVGEEADLLLAGALQEPFTHRNLLRIVDERTGTFLLLRALAELVEEHAVLFASVLVLQDDIYAPVLGLERSELLQERKYFSKHPLLVRTKYNKQFVLFSCTVMGRKWVAKINKGKYRYLIVYCT
jgi:hypothetical protein